MKSLIILILVILPQIHSTNAYFTDVGASSNNIFTVGDWTAPNSYVINPIDDPDDSRILATYQNTSAFTLYYIAEDNLSGIKEVQLYYSYNNEDWELFGADTIIDNEFQFTSPNGDGFYEFKTMAFDNAGNEEDEDGNDIGDSEDLTTIPVFLPTDASTTVDTTPPVTMLSVPSYLAVANELLYNGGFEEGILNGWTVGSDGDHKVVDTDSQTGNYSALIGFRDTPEGTMGYDSIKQNVSLPSLITSTLSFWYHLVTDDLVSVSGGFFDASVTSTGSDPLIVAHDGWDDPEVMEEDLGWKNVTYQLNGLEGENVDIQFKVTQPYEGYRTWSYLDDVKLTTATNSATTATELSLFSHDGSGADNSTINYSIDGVLQGDYTSPFTLPEGVHSISYSSTDEAGNSEIPKQATISAIAAPVDFGVVLNEFLPNPVGDDSATAPNGEWVELYNNSTNSANVDGWKMEDAGGNQMIISAVKTEGAGTVITAGGVLKVYRRGSAESSEPAFIMDNCDDTVKLLRPDDTQVDSYSYTFTIEGKSFARDPDGTGGWKDPEAEIPEVLEESAIEPTPTTSSIPETSPTPNPTAEPTPVSSTTPTPSPSPEVSPTPTPEPSNTPNPAPTPAVEPPADEFVKEAQAEEPPQNQIPLPEEGNEINE